MATSDHQAGLVDLVRKAIHEHETTLCLEFVNERLVQRIRNDPLLQAVGTPLTVRGMLVQFVLAGGTIECRKETREEYQDRREFWFRALVPVAGHPQPLFFELELSDDDQELPSVVILNVHF
jgi:hypothetical protein